MLHNKPASRPLLRRPKLLEKFGGVSKTLLYDWLAQSLITKPVAIGPRAVAWPEHEVDAIIDARVAGLGKEEIRALVRALEADRRDLAAEIKGGILSSKRGPPSAGETRKALASGAPAKASAPATNGAQP